MRQVGLFITTNSVLLFLFLAMFLIFKLNSCKRTNNSRVSPFAVVVSKTLVAAWFYSLLLLLSGDVEVNPEPTLATLFRFVVEI